MPRHRPHPPVTAAAPLAAAFANILCELAFLLAARARELAGFALLLQARVTRTSHRLAAILALAARGRAPRVRRHRPGRPSGPRPVPAPRRRQWLIETLGYQAAAHASQLRHLLEAPDTRAALAAAPPATRLAAARALRPLCHLLGVDLPPVLERAGPPPPPRRRRPRPRMPRAAGPRLTRDGLLPTDRPLPDYVRAAVRAWKRRGG